MAHVLDVAGGKGCGRGTFDDLQSQERRTSSGRPLGHSCPRRRESLSPRLPLRPTSILRPHLSDRLSYRFLNLLRRLVTKRPPEPLQNLEVSLPLLIHFGHVSYPVKTAATIAPAVPSTFRTTTSNSPTIHVLRFATSAFVA